MTVAELIEKLKVLPQDMEVVYSDQDLMNDYAECGFGDVNSVEIVKESGFENKLKPVVVLSADLYEDQG